MLFLLVLVSTSMSCAQSFCDECAIVESLVSTESVLAHGVWQRLSKGRLARATGQSALTWLLDRRFRFCGGEPGCLERLPRFLSEVLELTDMLKAGDVGT